MTEQLQTGDIVKAAVRTVCSQADIEHVQAALDGCRSQLHLQSSGASHTGSVAAPLTSLPYLLVPTLVPILVDTP
jgi:hypothetical protein